MIVSRRATGDRYEARLADGSQSGAVDAITWAGDAGQTLQARYRGGDAPAWLLGFPGQPSLPVGSLIVLDTTLSAFSPETWDTLFEIDPDDIISVPDESATLSDDTEGCAADGGHQDG